jgi:hypothetical protein
VRRRDRSTLGALAAWTTWAAGLPVAYAHAPLARSLAVGEDGAIAVHMPGFGIVLRTHEGMPYAYACNALVGLDPTDASIVWLRRDDGSLLAGTARGLLRMGADGCGFRRIDALADVPVTALAGGAGSAAIYAVTEGARPALRVSDDGGERWEVRGELPAATGDTALLVDAGSTRVYVSRVTGAGTSAVLRSDDDGRTFESILQNRELALLYLERPSLRLWARSREAGAVAILVADSLDRAWREVHRVRFFGGFAARSDGAELWIADEAGGLFRSLDRGQTFDTVSPDMQIACLAPPEGPTWLWACTPGLVTKPAVAVLATKAPPFRDVVTFAEVDRLVRCAPELHAEEVCAPAWAEWQADVLGGGATAAPPVVVADAGADAASEAPDADPSAGATDAATSAQRRDDGCGVAHPGTPRATPVAVACVLLCALARMRRRRAHIGRADRRVANGALHGG